MAVKVYGSLLSAAVLRVLVCLKEKDVEFEYLPLNMGVQEHKKQPFLSINPFGQVPGFEDGDLKLFESRGINKYIVHAYGSKGNQITFDDPKKMGLVYSWLDAEALKFDPPASKMVYELNVKPVFGMVTDDSTVEEEEKKLAAVLDVYEAQLKKSKYLAADCFTLADLHHIPCLAYLMKTKVKKLFDERPHVSAWCSDILARPSWVEVSGMK